MPQPQAQSRRVVAMFENRSLVSDAKHDARLKIQAGSVVTACVRFEETNAAVFATVNRLKKRLLSSRPRWMKIPDGILFAGLGTIRNEVEVALPAAKQASQLSAGLGFGSLRSPIQSMQSLVELAAKIVWPVASFTAAGITSRSTGRPAGSR